MSLSLKAKALLPGQGASATSDAKPAARLRGTSLMRIGWMLFLLVSIVILALTAYLFNAYAMRLDAAREMQARAAAENFVAAARGFVATHGVNLEGAVADDSLLLLLEQREGPAWRFRETELAARFPGAAGVRLVRAGTERVDLQTLPPLSYGVLDLMRQAEQGGRPPMEVHQSSGDQQYINLVRPVRDAAGTVHGHVLLSYALSTLRDAMALADIGGAYVELQQPASKGEPLVLAVKGNASVRNGMPAAMLPVAGSRWQVVYWPADAGVNWSPTLMAVGAALLLLAVIIWWLLTGLGRALARDQATLVELARDLRNRQVQTSYPTALPECARAVNRMLDIERESWDEGFMRGGGGVPGIGVEEELDHLVAGIEAHPGMIGVQHVNVDPSIFRAYDIRGVVDTTLTPEVVYEVGRAIGSEAAEREQARIVVGRDGRLSGPELMEALIQGLRDTGRDVIDVGMVPTPVVYYAAYHLEANSCVMLTGSHNPPQYNGMKIVLGGETLSGEAIQGLLARIQENRLVRGTGGLESVNVVPDYLERITGDYLADHGLKVVVDCGNGVAGAVAPALLRGLGCEVIELFCEVDGTFPNHHPDPSRPENLESLIQAVHVHGADLGMAFDGDGDRLGIVTSEGKVIWPDRLAMLFAMDILSRNPGAEIIYDVKCSRHLDKVIRDFGGRPLMWKTGHSLIKAKMRETGALMAAEMSGHLFLKERWFGFDDALYSAARLLEILANDHRPPGSVFASLPDSINTPELNLNMQEGEPPVFMARLAAAGGFEGARLSTIDGVRADYPDGFGLVRASNTTPCLVLRFEADSAEALERIQAAFRQAMLAADASLTLPF